MEFRRRCLGWPLTIGVACATLTCGIQIAAAQQTLPQERGTQQNPTDSRLFIPLVDGDPKNPQRFQRPRYGYTPAFGASTSGFDSTNKRVQRREQQNVQRRKASQTLAAQPLVAPTPDRTVAPQFQPPQASIAATRAHNRSAAAPDITGEIARPLRKNFVEEDPFAPLGIRAGSFILRPAIEVGGGYNSNPALAQTPKGSSFETVAPELNIRSDWSRHELTADLKGKYTWFNTLENFNKPDVDLGTRARIDITKQTRANLEARYKLLADSPSDPNLPQGIAKPPLYYQTGATAGLTHQFNRLVITANGLFDRTAYNQAELNDGTTISLKDRNYDQYAGVLRAGYELTPGITPFVEGGMDRRIHDLQYDFSGIQRDSDGRTIKAGSTFELTRHLVGEASIGYTQRDYVDPTLGKIHGMIYDSSLTYYATPLTTLKLTAASRIDESILPGVSGAFIRDFGLQIDHSFRRWLIGTLKFGFGQDDYEGSPRVDDRYLVSAGLIYKLTRELHLKGEVRREWLKSNIPGNDYTVNVALVGLRLQR